MTKEELKNFILTSYSNYFEYENDNGIDKFHLAKHLFTSDVYRCYSPILIIYNDTDGITFNELIELGGMDEPSLGIYLQTYETRTLQFKTLNEHMVSIIFDFLVKQINKLQIELKKYEMTKKLNNITEDFK